MPDFRRVPDVDRGARLAPLRFFADRDSQVERVRFWTPADADLLDVIPNADDVEATLHVGPMVRLATAGELAADEDVVSFLDTAFPERSTLLREGF